MSKYMVISRDDKRPYKSYQTIGGAKKFIRRLAPEDKALVKIVPVGIEAAKFRPNTEWIPSVKHYEKLH